MSKLNKEVLVEKKYCSYLVEEYVTDDDMFFESWYFAKYIPSNDYYLDLIICEHPTCSSIKDVENHILGMERKFAMLEVLVNYVSDMQTYSHHGENLGIPEKSCNLVVEDLYKLIYDDKDFVIPPN